MVNIGRNSGEDYYCCLKLSVAFAPDGKTVAASGFIQEWQDKNKEFIVQRRSDVMLCHVATGKLYDKVRVDEPVTSLAFLADGKIGPRRRPARGSEVTNADHVHRQCLGRPRSGKACAEESLGALWPRRREADL